MTDAGSTKQAIVEAARSPHRCAFLGGHPMAGKELRGAAAADGGSVPWPPVGSDGRTGPSRGPRLSQWLALFGAQEIILDAARHDRLVAWSSHLPQLASTRTGAVLQDDARMPPGGGAGIDGYDAAGDEFLRSLGRHPADQRTVHH